MNSTIKTDSMHEMLFEKRNKDYGAYVIRAAYNDTVIKSLVMVASTLLLFIGSAYAYNNFFADKVLAQDKEVELDVRSLAVDLTPIEEKKLAEPVKAHYTPKVDAPSTLIKDDAQPDPDQKVTLNAPPSKGTEGDTLDKDRLPPGIPTGGGIAAITPAPVVTPVLIADEMPEYPGGTKAMLEFFAKNIVYPERSKVLGNQGTVFVNFVIGKDGKVASYKVIKGVDEDCNEEALRIVAKMPAWKPGKNAGQAVPVMFNLPIRFKLD